MHTSPMCSTIVEFQHINAGVVYTSGILLYTAVISIGSVYTSATNKWVYSLVFATGSIYIYWWYAIIYTSNITQ